MTVELESPARPALDEFSYQNGYALAMTDIGHKGVRVELSHPFEGSAAVILPPEKTCMCVHWLLRTLALQHDSLAPEMLNILDELVERKPLEPSRRKKVRAALQVLRTIEP